VSVMSLLSVRAHVALRARLAAFLVLALIVTGMFSLRPGQIDGHRTPGQATSTYAVGVQPAGQRHSVSTSRAQLGQAGRLRHAGRRSPRYEEIPESAQPVAWPDMEKGAPTIPRLFFRKIPSDDGADADADAPQAPASGYRSRAPPSLA
jgi:hypothetical protein